jgi:hypothetical protein
MEGVRKRIYKEVKQLVDENHIDSVKRAFGITQQS